MTFSYPEVDIPSSILISSRIKRFFEKRIIITTNKSQSVHPVLKSVLSFFSLFRASIKHGMIYIAMRMKRIPIPHGFKISGGKVFSSL